MAQTNRAKVRGGARATVDHEEIRRWVEERGGKPAVVKRTNNGKAPGILRVDFPGFSGQQSLEEIDWDDWFERFESAKLAFLHQDETGPGRPSRFNKLVSRDTVEIGAENGRAQKQRAPRQSAKRSGARTGAKRSGARTSAKRSGARTSAKRSGARTSAKRSGARTSAKRSSAKRSSARKGAETTGKRNQRESGSRRGSAGGTRQQKLEGRAAAPARGRATGARARGRRE
jgi:hypothetical protein